MIEFVEMITPLRHTPFLPGTLQNLFYPPVQYTYFARAAELPFATGSPLVKAAWAMDAAMLAYARYGADRMTDAQLDQNFNRAGLKYQKIGGTPADWNAPGTQAVFAWCDQFAILTFRGTESDDPDDVISDLDITLKREPDYRPAPNDPQVALGPLSFVSNLFGDAYVHHGFQNALNQVWNTVHALVTDYRQNNSHNEICFTGHSLGAALAVLAYSRFSDPDISLYTFGCPRVGDAAFRDRVLSNPGRGIYRYVNYNDAVTHVPTDSLLYRQAPGPCYRFTVEGNLDNDDDASFRGDVESLRAAIVGLPQTIADLNQIDAPPSLVDHSPARYCFRLWDCV